MIIIIFDTENKIQFLFDNLYAELKIIDQRSVLITGSSESD